MTVQIIKGDLLEAFDNGDVDVIGHVVNCQGVMGSGIAKSIREQYPQVYLEYKALFDSTKDNIDLLGKCQKVPLKGTSQKESPYLMKGILNLHAQFNFGNSGRFLNYGAFGQCLASSTLSLGDTVYGFPYKMGSDRAGGDWNIVLEMIEFYFKNLDVKIYKLEK